MKQQLLKEDDVIREMKKALAETLRIEEDTIQADSSLINDLGAESLDFLDVVYQMEQTFGIKMARHQVLELEPLHHVTAAVRIHGCHSDLARCLTGQQAVRDLRAAVEMGADSTDLDVELPDDAAAAAWAMDSSIGFG